jgi:allantoicase
MLPILLFVAGRPVTHVRLDVHPDGGMARLRIWGELIGPADRD